MQWGNKATDTRKSINDRVVGCRLAKISLLTKEFVY